MKEIHISEPHKVEIIDPSAYSDTPIGELIQILGDPDNVLSPSEIEKLIADFVVKYLMVYLIAMPKDKVMPLEDVNMFFGWMCAIMDAPRLYEGGKVGIHYPPEIDFFIQSFNPVQHASVLVGDVASTTAIMRDIVSYNLDQEGDKPYVGLDLGTGSGILLLAMKMQAMRNGNQNMILVGMDSHEPSLRRAGRTLSILGEDNDSALFLANTTDRNSYHASKGLGEPTFICNETLPAQNIPFYIEGHPSEPFFSNHYALHEAYGGSIHQATPHFPHKVEVLLSNRCIPGVTEIEEKDIITETSNGFQQEIMGSMDEETFMMLSPKRVQNTSQTNLTPLEQVGDELRQKTWDPDNPRRIIPANLTARLRWTNPRILDENFS